MTTIYQRLRDTWLANHVSINDSATPLSIESFEKQHRIKLPPQFCDYLLTSNGMEEGQTDRGLISFLSLDAIDREMASRTRESRDFVDVIFAEYLIYSHYYALRVTTDGTQLGVYAADGTHEKRLARSFDDFVDAYLSNPEATAHCW